jgi:hypothetical protein
MSDKFTKAVFVYILVVITIVMAVMLYVMVASMNCECDMFPPEDGLYHSESIPSEQLQTYGVLVNPTPTPRPAQRNVTHCMQDNPDFCTRTGGK